jgi:hypothetical protein
MIGSRYRFADPKAQLIVYIVLGTTCLKGLATDC